MTIYKTLAISAAHQLDLPYDSKCNRLHGHNFKIEIWISGEINKHGMVVDFYEIKQIVMKYDHQNLNEFIVIPTAENIAIKLSEDLQSLETGKPTRMKIRVWETSTAYAEYETTIKP